MLVDRQKPSSPPVERPPRTVPGFLGWRAALDPDHVAIEVHGRSTLTLAQWDAGATAVAGALRRQGVGRADRVGLLFGAADWSDFAIAYCGVQRAGAVAVPLSDRLADNQIEYALAQSGAVGVLHGGRAPTTAGWSATVPELTASGEFARDDLARPGDLAQILYTSGTSGRPKGVAATHANLSLSAPIHPRRLRLAHSIQFVHAFAIGTNAAQTMLLNALYVRPGALTLATFTPARFARLIESPRVGTVFLVPSVAVELLDSAALTERDLSHIHLLGSTAAPLPPPVALRLARAFPAAAIVNYYTSTEAAPAEASMIFDPSRPDAVGRAADGTLMIADADGEPVPPGVTGDVWLRCPFPRAYYRDAGASAATFRGEWVRMGDVGRLDPDGYLHLTDRQEDIVKSGAFKLSTVEVETALYEHPLVAQAAVIGVAHPVLGSVLAAIVVPRPDAPPGEPSLRTLRNFLSSRLADYQLPAKVHLRDELPRNQGGKVLKRLLVEEFTAAGARPADSTGEEPQ
jgi:acyl-CoA synthetase (AMP-forming)/AMP-acid ligase II